MIEISSSGSFSRTDSWLKRMRKGEIYDRLDRYGKEGCAALAAATPVDSNLTANSWEYEVIKKRGKYTIIWRNTNVISGVPVAILIQYGHATGTGGWVDGTDYINPVIQPLFKRIADDIWKEVKRDG